MGVVANPRITLEELYRLPGDGVQHEMSAGQLMTMPPPPFSHAKVALAVLEALLRYLPDKDSKVIPETGYLLSSNPLTVRQPDLSVLSKKRFDATKHGYCIGAPELAIEVISPSNEEDDINLKIAQYLQYGAIEV
jgi:Uma2 family endonuclease